MRALSFYITLMQLPIPAAPAVPTEAVYSPLTYIALVRCLYALLAFTYAIIWFLDDSKSDSNNTQLLLFTVSEIFIFTLLTCLGLRKRRFISAITYVGMCHDAALAALLVLLTNITSSPFDFLFLVIPIYGGLLLKKRGGLIAAGISIIAILVLYCVIPMLQVDSSWLIYPYIFESGITSQNVSWREPTTLALAAIGVGILTGQLAFNYEKVKEKLVLTARDFNHLHGIYAKVLNALPVGVIIIHPESNEILFSNDIAKSYYNNNLVNFTHNLPPMSKTLTAWDQTVENTNKILQISYFSIKIEGMSMLDGYHISDVTDLREAHKKAQIKQRLEHLGEFSAKVAHEIRNPLACISGCAEMLQADAQTEDQKQITEMMTTEIDRLDNLLKDILVFSRTPKLAITSIHLNEFLNIQKNLFLQKQTADNLTITISGDENISIQTDSNILTQIVFTLWQNALEAIPNNCSISVSFDQTHMTITDNGPGIPSDIEPHIFEPFYTTKPDGTGLGLATARQLAREIKFDLTHSAEPHAFTLSFSNYSDAEI